MIKAKLIKNENNIIIENNSDIKTVKARFKNDNAIIMEIEAVSEVKRVNVSSAKNHNSLYNRDLPDQHPIDAITGLREALNQGDDKTYVHEQGEASDTWVIEHNLNKHPSVTLVDSANTQFEAEITYDTTNKCTVRMNGATKGKAFLN